MYFSFQRQFFVLVTFVDLWIAILKQVPHQLVHFHPLFLPFPYLCQLGKLSAELLHPRENLWPFGLIGLGSAHQEGDLVAVSLSPHQLIGAEQEEETARMLQLWLKESRNVLQLGFELIVLSKKQVELELDDHQVQFEVVWYGTHFLFDQYQDPAEFSQDVHLLFLRYSLFLFLSLLLVQYNEVQTAVYCQQFLPDFFGGLIFQGNFSQLRNNKGNLVFPCHLNFEHFSNKYSEGLAFA